jgi:aryl-phospho-beta-D-glucosidase BglC (GH1 family)
MSPEIWLSTHGPRIETSSGTPVVLRGVGLGGWMNMENFITGYPSAESLQRRALFKVLGEENYARFFSRLLDVFFTDEDAAFLASLGANCVRLPVNYRHFEDDMAPFELKEEGFVLLDRAIQRCARHGIYTVIDLHALPGAQNQHWHSDNPTHWASFWQHKHFQDRAVNLWEALARRYRDNPWVAGYNPINEPGDAEGIAIWPFYQRLHAAVRAIDTRHILFLDGNRYSTDFTIFKEVWPNTVYTCHDYALPGFADGGDYPGTSRGAYVDRDAVESVFLERTKFMRETGTPIWVGEFGPVYTGDATRDEMRYQLLTDQLAIYEAYYAGWSLWTYKDVGLQGLVYTSASSPYVERIKPILAKKARLGVDGWGTTGTEVPEIMTPVANTFRQEFPHFAPFPFGQAPWVAILVKQILLAEPMVDDFADCFSGLSGEALDRLADSFRFSSCTRRERLLQVLKAAFSETSPG